MTRLGNNILCDYLIDIYKNHLHPNLILDELFFSVQIENDFLDLWNNAYIEKYEYVEHLDDFEYIIRYGACILAWVDYHSIIISSSELDRIIFKKTFQTDNFYNELIKKYNLEIKLKK